MMNEGLPQSSPLGLFVKTETYATFRESRKQSVTDGAAASQPAYVVCCISFFLIHELKELCD